MCVELTRSKWRKSQVDRRGHQLAEIGDVDWRGGRLGMGERQV